ncbi:hypothetical protein MTR67_007996 [Solanum verrucosum]|uniref:Reverse transcriptase zinc-binding domain-containing protein n=1 Tax=Solanum verrucosum TaxID=315347 RepID=A0AAF0Q0V2_SOLVR|nr:hypothetical protein MTR67_007996 [Solanum verrucosum]
MERDLDSGELKLLLIGSIAAWGACLSRDNLQKKGFALSNICYLCEEELETVNHIPMHCRIARQCWEFLFQYLWDLLDHASEYEGIIGELAAPENT